jgi:hypothetical protein
MDIDILVDKLGPPDIEIETLRFWIHSRQFPEAMDFWDGNWVNVTVHCSAEGANVTVEGPILHLPELKAWIDGCQRMYDNLSGRAELNCIEPNLAVEMSADKTGQVEMEVDITADQMCQAHHFKFTLDQSYLPGLIRGCNKVLEKYPLREKSAG